MEKILNRVTIYLVISLFTLVGMVLFLTNPPLLAEKKPKNNNTIAPHIPTGDDIEVTIDQIIADGLTEPVQVTHAGDGSGRLFVVEKRGRIRIIENGALLATPFLDIRHLIRIVSWEQGLLSLAFHPDYEQNGYFYVYYTDLAGDTVVARYSLSDDANIADPNSAFTILALDQPGANHNGGQLAFGPLDNYLYISLGDGGTEEPYAYHSQDRTTLLGKLLRIYVSDVSQDSVPYQIPSDNPYIQIPEYRDEIWAFGLRNPWRFSFDRETGDLYIGDVGHNQWEEVDYLAAGSSGVNFGWSCLEASQIWNDDDCGLGNFTAPIVEYERFVSDAVIGGFVYRGQAFRALTGRYFYAEFNEGKIWSLYKSGQNSWSTPELELDTDIRISAFGEDEDGELYVVDYDGTIRRLADATKVGFDLTSSKKSVSTPHADPGEVITYTILVQNTGEPVDQTFSVADEIPNGLAYVPGSLQATAGTVDDSQNPILRWQGSLHFQSQILITYQATVSQNVTGTLINDAILTAPLMPPLTLSAPIFVPRPVLTTTKKDFFLPGTQPNQLIDQIPNPEGCDYCHTDPIYDQWRGSMMSQAGRDPLFWAALYVANNDVPNVGDYCLRCHTPKAWLEGRSDPADGSALQSEDIETGVSCELCHRMVDPVPSMSDEATAIDAAIRDALTTTLPLNHVGSAMMILDPKDNRRGPFSMDNPYHTALRTDFLGQSTNYVTQSRMCGTCHNLDNPILSWDSERNQYWPNDADLASESFDNGDLFPIERTYDEWLNSQYATTGVYAPQFAGEKPDGIVGSCQDCHMPRRTGIAAEETFNPVERDCLTTGCLPAHELVGGNTWVPEILQDTRWRLHSADEAPYLNQTIRSAKQMLQKAATLSVTLSTSDTHKIAAVRVINETGHKLPTSYPEGRRMWLNFRAYNEQHELIYESGAYDWDTAILTSDPDIKIYEAKHGLTPELADFLERPAGESFHFTLNNIILKDNRIPPRGYTQAAFSQPGLEPVGATYQDGQYWDDTVYTLPLETESVVATLYYQTSSKEYIDFLRENGGPDGAVLGELWDDSKSAPEIMAVAFTPSYPLYLPLLFR